LGILGLTGLRSFDLASNRYYLNKETTEAFGTGLSWWYPERAAAFVESEQLPRNVFNVWSLGGYLAWRLPAYPDFIDGRGKPFNEAVFSAAVVLPGKAPDSTAWAAAADRWGFNTIVVATGRYAGLIDFPNLKDFCESKTWRPVYLDEVSAVFVRRSAETQALVDRLQINCATFLLTPPKVSNTSVAGRAQLFNFWSNSAVVLDVLGRSQEALSALTTAEQLVPLSGPVHFERGDLLGKLGSLAEAERELRAAVELRPDENCWFGLSSVLWAEQRYDEAAEALRKAAELSLTPQRYYVQLARLELQRRRPTQSLEALDLAMKFSVVQDESAMGAEFQAEVAEGRAQAWFALGDMQRAAGFEEQAVRFTPGNADRWKDMANLYQAMGRTSEASRAMQHAQSTSSTQSGSAVQR
jgi:tetratricopeptide (TPR) repeat protein